MTLFLNMSLESPEDWIYGSGISSDNSSIYIGCYSGKTYKSNLNGTVEKIFIIPEDKDSDYGTTNPVTDILEYGNILHLLSYNYLYVLQNDNCINYLKVEEGEIKWFEYGFVHLKTYIVSIYDIYGELIDTISFKHIIKDICFNNNIIIINTTNCAYAFRLKNNLNQSGSDGSSGE